MSKINNYVIWCEENGYTDEEGEVVSMEYANEYMKSKEYDREHKEQAFKQALSEADENSLFGMMHKLGYLVQRHKDLKS
jgi:arginine utilization protein RocB